MSFSDYLENKVLDHILGNAAYTAPGTVYLALSETNPLDTGAGMSEPSGSGYARAPVTNNLTNWPSASGGSKSNGVVVEFTASGGSWPTVGYFALFDAASGGNMILHGALSAPQTLGDGESLRFGVGALSMSLD